MRQETAGKNITDLAMKLFICLMTASVVYTRPLDDQRTYHPSCEPAKMIHYFSSLVNHTLVLYLEVNDKHNDIKHWKNFTELHVPENKLTQDEYRNVSMCGLNFMTSAFKLVEQQQIQINLHNVTLLQSLKKTIEYMHWLLPCMEEVVGKQKCPEFVSHNFTTYQMKQWGKDVLGQSVEFLEWLQKTLNYFLNLFELENLWGLSLIERKEVYSI